MRWADERADVTRGTRPSARKASRPVSGRGQGRQSPKARARSASLGPGRSLVYFNTVAPRRSGFFVSVIPRIKILSAPGRPDITSADLTPASRRQDHTTSPSAKALFVCAPSDRSRAKTRPAIPSRAQRCRVHRIPCPTSVTIAKRPSVGRDGRAYRSDLGQARTEIFLQPGLDIPTARRANQPAYSPYLEEQRRKA